MSEFAKRMMAQKLMAESRDDPFSDSQFFTGLGSALLGEDDVRDRGTILPVGRSPEGNLVPAFPEFVTGLAQGVRGAAQTVGRAMQGDPRYIPVDGKLPDQVVDEIANLGLTFGGAGVTGANLLRGSIPEGAIGIFAGQRAKNFPVATEAQQKSQNILQEQNQLVNEFDSISNELTKGRMALGDERTDRLVVQRDEIADRLDQNTSELGKLEAQSIDELEKRFAATDEKTFFRETDRDFDKGLFKLPDNQFRFEIDDRPATIKIDIDDDADALFDTITSDALERVLPRTDMGVTKRLDEILNHDELFENYPQLKDYRTKIVFDPKLQYRGSFSPYTNTITINIADFRPLGEKPVSGATLKNQIKSTLVHEIQHAVQEIEGFARGSSTSVGNPFTAVEQALANKQAIIETNQSAADLYNTTRDQIVRLGSAQRIKKYEEMSKRDSHQPRLLFNQSNWYQYGDEIRRELFDELGYSYNKRKSPKRELWISAAFAKLALKERAENAAGAALADQLTAKEIKSQYGKANRILDKNYDAWAKTRNARSAIDQIQQSQRYAGGTEQAKFNIYSDTLGEAEARAVQARAQPVSQYSYMRSVFPPDQFQEGGMLNPPPFGLQNTLRQQGGFFKE